MADSRPQHPAELELARLRQVHAQRHLILFADRVAELADVIQLCREGNPAARQLLGRWLELNQDAEAALAGVHIVRKALES